MKKKLYEILNERELDRVKEANIKDTLIHQLTIGDVMHLKHCLEANPYYTEAEALTVILNRAGYV